MDENNQSTPANEEQKEPATPEPPKTEVTVPPDKPKMSRKKLILIIVIVIVAMLALVAGAMYYYGSKHNCSSAGKLFGKCHQTSSVNNSNKTSTTTTANVQGLQLDTSKNYGNKYADGVLPVGDGKYTTNQPKQGYVDACSNYAQNLVNDSGGAMTRGPWFTNNNTEYDVNKKVHVQGDVHWDGTFTDTVSGDTRTIVSNDLPVSDPTGVFPIASTDPAYAYDHNPNSIQSQNFTYALAANPTYSNSPNCESGQVGVMTSGVALFNALDAGGRDAGAWETQDSCDGHPQMDGIYHYHTLSSCIKDTSVHDVIGYALDGFPITGPKVSNNNILTTSDLDECHGIVSQITLDGKSVTMYHYVMTEDFPYSISCYRGTPITPPGQQTGSNIGTNRVGQSKQQQP